MTDASLVAAARLSVAPMMDWTDRHCRFFHRQITSRALLYTEMLNAHAVIRGERAQLLGFERAELPLALQLGGAEPALLAQAAAIGADLGFDEINLNCGCPSDRVQSGSFGAVLMETPALVAECVAAMIAAQPAPVTVKCRLGVDDQRAEDTLPAFLQAIADAGVTRVIIHARKAWLKGLSPKENREIPPLDYDLALQMKGAFPMLHVSINGGITTLDQAETLLAAGFDGVMLGRAAYHDPMSVLAEADARIFGSGQTREPADIIDAMRPYIARHLASGGRLQQITRHMLGLFHGRPGARHWRRSLSEARADAGLDAIDRALALPESRAA